MRVLALDVGRRRVGLAISDRTRTLARPLMTITVEADNALARVTTQIAALAAEEDGVSEIVVGLPAHLSGEASPQTAQVQAFIVGLRARTSIPVVTEDERLSSREAESRLAVGEKDWRKRKTRLDAAAAAVFLQDYLDRRRTPVAGAAFDADDPDDQAR
jgi:putative pre-16S rRNA nuclease